jgi:hypothetical protein
MRPEDAGPEPAEVFVEIAPDRHEIADVDACRAAPRMQALGGHATGGIAVACDIESREHDDWARRSGGGCTVGDAAAGARGDCYGPKAEATDPRRLIQDPENGYMAAGATEFTSHTPVLHATSEQNAEFCSHRTTIANAPTGETRCLEARVCARSSC